MPVPARKLTVEAAAASPDWQVIRGAAGAAAAGLLLTAAVWPAQRRFTALMRSRQPPTGHTGRPGA